ncbi:MAG: immunity 50 family protein [Tannerella sp.]|jgi:hypothetical protein|nr:immunity 50 family protein [Tannerella sp.]
MTIEKQSIEVLSCDLKHDIFPYYLIKYQADKPLSYRNYDNIWIINTEERQFIATVRNVKDYSMELYISQEYESSMIGNIKTWLLFSPTVSIEGASEIIKLTETFPPCHYENILSYITTKDKIELQISIETHNRTMELHLFDLVENNLKNYEETNIIFQLVFSYCDNGIRVEIDSETGLNGTVICKRIIARLI